MHCCIIALTNSIDMGFKHFRLIFAIAIALFFASCSSESSNSEDNTKSCLIGFDWVYPNGSNPTGAWKFSADGTFNSSTTFFGGMSTWGDWEVIAPGEIRISYTRTTEGTIPGDQTLTMESCGTLKVGSTQYIKD
jgi:hypothetical protein